MFGISTRPQPVSVPDLPAGRSGEANAVEAALLERTALGDLRAFETLYRGYFPRLTRFL